MGRSYFPLFVDLLDQPVLVVGGGEVAARKIRLLLKAGAQPRVVALELNEELAGWVGDGRALHLAKQFQADQLRGCRLAIAATDDAQLNRAVACAAEAAGVMCNVVDDAKASRFITPSIVERAPITVAISSAGAAPVLARRLRERIESLLPAGYGRIAEFMERHRDRAKRLPVPARRRLWEDFLDGPGPERLLANDEVAAVFELESLLRGAAARGEVYLVGAGPGDPDLLTFRALRLMQQCDVVLYDALIAPPILDLVRRDEFEAVRELAANARAEQERLAERVAALEARLARSGRDTDE